MFTVLADQFAVLAQRGLTGQTGNRSSNIPGKVAVGLQDATALVAICECL